MSKFKPTDDQKKAIESRGKNIIVSAAAGSGKTRVLVDRLVSIMLEEKIPIKNMIIVTFTNKASVEMKDRIRQKLNDLLKEENSDKIFIKNQIKSIANIELLRVNERSLLLIIVYDNGLIVNDLIYLRYIIEEEELEFVNRLLQSELIGSNILHLSDKIRKIEEKLNLNYKYLLDVIQTKMKNESIKDSNKDIKIEGLGNIFNFKEFDDIVKAKEFINLFESPDIITDFLTDNNDKSLVITIGEENEIDQLKENTIITSYFKVDENTIGKIGVVGLTRINYKEVIESIKLVSDILNQ